MHFSGNSISSIEKRVWKGYPWAEYLGTGDVCSCKSKSYLKYQSPRKLLKDNDLSKLQKDSLEGLLSLKHLYDSMLEL
ncbi:unnamed protein product [Lepidochelys olivacea]